MLHPKVTSNVNITISKCWLMEITRGFMAWIKKIRDVLNYSALLGSNQLHKVYPFGDDADSNCASLESKTCFLLTKILRVKIPPAKRYSRHVCGEYISTHINTWLSSFWRNKHGYVVRCGVPLLMFCIYMYH